MKLLLDVGNQRCKAAVYDGRELHHYHAVDINDAVAHYLPSAVRDGTVKVDEVRVASVHKENFNRRLSGELESLLKQTPQFAEVKPMLAGLAGFTTRYDPAMLGVDRFLALVGAWQCFGKACVVIDCGTAVTIDVLDAQGVHQGGLIMPGLKIIKEQLYSGAAQLGPGQGERSVFPKDTAAAIDAGCRYMLKAMIDNALSDMQTEPGGLVVVTGGDGDWYAATDEQFVYRKTLVLEGLGEFAGSKD